MELAIGGASGLGEPHHMAPKCGGEHSLYDVYISFGGGVLRLRPSQRASPVNPKLENPRQAPGACPACFDECEVLGKTEPLLPLTGCPWDCYDGTQLHPATLLAWSIRTGITYVMLVTPPEDQLDALVSARGYIAHLLPFSVRW